MEIQKAAGVLAAFFLFGGVFVVLQKNKMSKRKKRKQNSPIVNIQQLVSDPKFQLMNDILSLAGRLVRQNPEFVKMTDEQRDMIDKLGQTADNVKEKQEEIIRQN